MLLSLWFIILHIRAMSKSNTPQQAAGYLTLAAFAKYPHRRGCLAPCPREQTLSVEAENLRLQKPYI